MKIIQKFGSIKYYKTGYIKCALGIKFDFSGIKIMPRDFSSNPNKPFPTLWKWVDEKLMKRSQRCDDLPLLLRKVHSKSKIPPPKEKKIENLPPSLTNAKETTGIENDERA